MSTSTKFNIYYSTTPNGPWTLANVTPIARVSSGNEYTITGLTYGALYYIVIVGGILDDSNDFIPLVSQSIGPKTVGVAGVGADQQPTLSARTWLPDITDEDGFAHEFEVV